MAKLPPLKRIHTEDLQDAPRWMQRVLRTINSFFQNTWQALDKGLTLQDNFNSAILDVQITGGETVTFPSPLQVPVTAALVGKITGPAISSGVSVIWRQIEQNIEITEITGLQAGEQYVVKIILL